MKIAISKIRARLGFTLLISTLITLLIILPNVINAQTDATPMPINIPSRTATQLVVISATPSRTPTAVGSAVVEAKDKTVGANIRQSPDPNSEKLGTIFPGHFYPIEGKYGNWYQILYGQPNPDSTGWVYGEIVNVTGPSNAIPTAPDVPTANLSTAAAKNTAVYLTQTPGAPGSATALQLSATGVSVNDPNSSGTAQATSSGPLPTFTFPPPLVEATLAPRTSTRPNQGGLPPIVPIIGLLVVGLLGLLISGLRRN